MSLPNLVIIGAMKCGTTSLYKYLDMHPEIRMSELKEPDFFVDAWEELWDLRIPRGRWHEGIDWYRSHFTGSEKIKGEATVNYTKHPHILGVPKRMYSIIPDAKLIYVVRNPLERLQSHYVHYIADKWGTKDFKDLLGDIQNNYYINCTRYYLQLEQFLEFYPLEQILVVRFEDLKNKRRETLRSVFGFLGVDPSFTHPDFDRVFHPTSKVTWTPLGDFLNKELDQNPELIPVVEHLQNKKPHLLGSPVQKPHIDIDLKKRILEALYDDTQKLESLLGWDLSSWYSGLGHKKTKKPALLRLSRYYRNQGKTDRAVYYEQRARSAGKS